jgi:hypothetical protein
VLQCLLEEVSVDSNETDKSTADDLPPPDEGEEEG